MQTHGSLPESVPREERQALMGQSTVTCIGHRTGTTRVRSEWHSGIGMRFGLATQTLLTVMAVGCSQQSLWFNGSAIESDAVVCVELVVTSCEELKPHVIKQPVLA